jgi:hypothetical protein
MLIKWTKLCQYSTSHLPTNPLLEDSYTLGIAGLRFTKIFAPTGGISASTTHLPSGLLPSYTSENLTSYLVTKYATNIFSSKSNKNRPGHAYLP